jgi:hypothetical protein
MQQDNADTPITPQPATRQPVRRGPNLDDDIPELLYCGCGHPMHPDHLEERRGVMLERYTCPRRRWWNAWHHPHAWMAPREGMPS